MDKKALMNYLPYIFVRKRLEKQESFGEEARKAPELFNAKGEQIHVFYLQDKMSMHAPYTMVAGRMPEKILWDRFNKGLPIHFYNHQEIFKPSKYAEKRFGVLRESEAIVPEDYKKVLKNVEFIKEFDRIFTHNEEILNKFQNASFVPAYGVWYGTERYGGKMDELSYQKKTKEVSIISSDKTMSELHKLRYSLARKYINSSKVDAYGKACNRYIAMKSDALEKYRYSIVVENEITSYYFTEKILDCFASMTVPIYIGATKINEFFNGNGIIRLGLDEIDQLDNIIDQCTKRDYEERIEAIKDNYNRVQKYLCFENYILQEYQDYFKLI